MTSPFCEKCRQLENSKHYLYECKSLIFFWKRFNCVINELFNFNITIGWNHIVLGYNIGCKRLKMLNVFLMLATFAVYKARLTDITCIEKYLIDELSILKFIYKQDKKTIIELIELM